MKILFPFDIKNAIDNDCLHIRRLSTSDNTVSLHRTLHRLLLHMSIVNLEQMTSTMNLNFGVFQFFPKVVCCIRNSMM